MPIVPQFRTNSGFTAKQLVMLGSGIGLLPDYAVLDDLSSGRLVRLLPEWHHRPGDISDLFAHRKQMPSRIRFFLNFIEGGRQFNRPMRSRPHDPLGVSGHSMDECSYFFHFMRCCIASIPTAFARS